MHRDWGNRHHPSNHHKNGHQVHGRRGKQFTNARVTSSTRASVSSSKSDFDFLSRNLKLSKSISAKPCASMLFLNRDLIIGSKGCSCVTFVTHIVWALNRPPRGNHIYRRGVPGRVGLVAVGRAPMIAHHMSQIAKQVRQMQTMTHQLTEESRGDMKQGARGEVVVLIESVAEMPAGSINGRWRRAQPGLGVPGRTR